MKQLLIILLASCSWCALQSQTVEPSVAWGVDDPLGDHREATIDTLFEDFHRTAVPSLPSAAWATTGNYGSAGQNQLFFERPMTSEFFMEDAIAHWLHTTASHRFYNTRIPMTLLGHATGGDKYSNQDRTRGVFSGNVNRRLQIGAGLDYIYSKGSYDHQADKNFDWHGMASYMGDRYELQTFFSHYSYTTLENGGITDDRYITDPAAVQGGVTRVDNKSITTRLNAAQNSLESSHLYVNQRYKVGFYRTQRDSVTDSIVSRIQSRYFELEQEIDQHQSRWGMSRSEFDSAVKSFVSYAQKRPGRLLYFLSNKFSKNEFEHYFGELARSVDLIDDKGKSFSYYK